MDTNYTDHIITYLLASAQLNTFIVLCVLQFYEILFYYMLKIFERQ